MARRSGINTFEVVVVIIVIGVLVALLLLAINPAREASRQQAAVDDSRSMDSLSTEAYKSLAMAKATIAGQPAADQPPAAKILGGARKIIYESQLNLVVEDITAVERDVAQLTKDMGGYVAEASVDRSEGERINGHWRLRIPADKLDSFLEAVSELGVVENRHQQAQDVTEQFVDLEAQIANKKKLEQRLVKLLEDTTGQLKDVIEVERELARVRTEIEQMEGRLRYLTNRTDLSTVAISARVEKNYKPPTAPELEKRVQTAWESSLEKLKTFGEQALVAAVYAGPWIGVALVLLVPTFWYISLRRRRGAA